MSSTMAQARRSHALTPANHRTLEPLLADLTAVVGELWKRVGELAAEVGQQPADWPRRNEMGKILAELAMAADVLQLTPK